MPWAGFKISVILHCSFLASDNIHNSQRIGTAVLEKLILTYARHCSIVSSKKPLGARWQRIHQKRQKQEQELRQEQPRGQEQRQGVGPGEQRVRSPKVYLKKPALPYSDDPNLLRTRQSAREVPNKHHERDSKRANEVVEHIQLFRYSNSQNLTAMRHTTCPLRLHYRDIGQWNQWGIVVVASLALPTSLSFSSNNIVAN